MFSQKYSFLTPVILRFALAVVYLWFGFSQLHNPSAWIGFVPSWAVSFSGLNENIIVYINSFFEIIAGSMLVFGIFVSHVAFLLFLHLLVITLHLGLGPISVRDFGLSFATLALALFGKDKYCISSQKPEKNVIA